jgi:hypothetical protein
MLQDLTNSKKGSGLDKRAVNMLGNMDKANQQSNSTLRQGGGLSQLGKGRL